MALGQKLRRLREDVEKISSYSFESGEKVETLVINVRHAYTDAGGLSGLKNDYRERLSPVLPSLRERLEYLLARTNKEASERLVSLRSDTLYKRWKKHLEKLELRFIPPKLLRHVSDTLALTSGVGSDLNSRMHGRARVQTTYAHYFRPDIAALETASSKIDALIRPESDSKKRSGSV